MDAERRGCACVGAVFALIIVVLVILALAFWIANYDTATRSRGSRPVATTHFTMAVDDLEPIPPVLR